MNMAVKMSLLTTLMNVKLKELQDNKYSCHDDILDNKGGNEKEINVKIMSMNTKQTKMT